MSAPISIQGDAQNETKDSPAPSKTFFLASDGDGRQIVSIHIKQIYHLLDDGRCESGDAEQPLLFGDEMGEESGFSETDIIPFKQNTDLIVMSDAWARGARSVLASIRVGEVTRDYLVTGQRRVIYRGQGSWAFSEPKPFESMGMCYANAYGGFDENEPENDIRYPIDMFASHPGLYPRNPIGKGYAVHENRQRLDGLLLPNLEHPRMLLSPENLLVGTPSQWWRAPLPWSCDWFGKTWYPRVVYFRGIPDGLPDDDRTVPEVALGWLDAGHGKAVPALDEGHPYDNRIGDAASPALVLPTMRGDERIELVHMTPGGRLVVQLPPNRPRVTVRYRGQSCDVPVVPHRILISTIEMGVYIVWHAAWYPPRMLPDKPLGPEASMAEAMEGVEVSVDTKKIAALDTDGA